MRVGLLCRKKHYKVKIIIAFLALLGSLYIVLKRVEPAFYTQLSCYANTIVTDRVNKAVYLAFEDYDIFSEISHDENGMVRSIESKSQNINRLKTTVIINVQDELNKISSGFIHIPLASISDFAVLSGIGITIPIKVVPMTLVEAEFDENFISSGINQTRHKMDIIIKVRVCYSGFMLNKTDTIETQVPLINTVINGDVPQYYGNLSGTEGVFD